MMHFKYLAAAQMLSMLAGAALRADDVKYTEENGIRYQVTTQVVQRPVTHTTYEPRETTTLRERYTTDMHDIQRTYQVPVTQQQWVPGYQKTWNVFAPPVLSYRLMPVTRWETRTETVRVPSTRRELVPEKQTQHVPVTKTHVVNEEHTRKIYAGIAGNGPGAAAAPIASSNDSRVQPVDPQQADSGRDDSADYISRRK